MFSWPRLRDADPLLRCEMASTGEVIFKILFIYIRGSLLHFSCRGDRACDEENPANDLEKRSLVFRLSVIASCYHTA